MRDDVESRPHNSQVPVRVVRRANRSAEGMVRDEGSRQAHVFSDVAERGDVHADGCDSGFLDCSCNVPDRHVTDRSHRYEEEHVDARILDLLNPSGDCGLPQPALGGGSGE